MEPIILECVGDSGGPGIFVCVGAYPKFLCGFWRWTPRFHASFECGPKSDGPTSPVTIYVECRAPLVRGGVSRGGPGGPKSIWLMSVV